MKALVALVLVFSACAAFAKDLGVQGEVHQIREIDWRYLLFDSMDAVDWDKVIEDKRSELRDHLRNYLAFDLPEAQTTQGAYVQVVYRVERDIEVPEVPEAGLKRQVIARKGDTVSPLDHLSVEAIPRLFVFDARSERQLALASRLVGVAPPPGMAGVEFVITAGDVVETAKRLGRPVFVLERRIKEAAQVERVPTFVSFYESKVGKGIYRLELSPDDGGAIQSILDSWLVTADEEEARP